MDDPPPGSATPPPDAQQASGLDLARKLRRRWRLLDFAANVVGALVVFIFLRVLHDAVGIHGSDEHIAIVTLAFVAYLALALPVGWAWEERGRARLWQWLAAGGPPGAEERETVLREPLRCVEVQMILWAAAALLFGSFMLTESTHGAIEVALTIALGGITTSALTYLLIERLLRPVTARALAAGPPERPVGLGVPARLITAWAVASGVPLLGVALLAIGALGGEFDDASSLAAAVLVLSAAGIAAGAFAAVLSAYSLADPLGAVRRALARVRAGDLDVQVPIDDASELGLLQAGFNEMAAGLRERERLRDLFGRHVGDDVARQALAEGAPLGGDVRAVAALFVDLVGSTALAARVPPEEVVSLLNRFFAVVVDVVEAHGGFVNRFEGDGALCVFGAPIEQPDPAGSALAAGRLLRERLQLELPEVEVGIGISAGPAVAGNVGAERRLEYTVIGDPVNEAARLCELAKHQPGRVLASTSALSRASRHESTRWRLGRETVLRGRGAPTRVAFPADDRIRELRTPPVRTGG